jgi:hypothetical protein
MIQGQNKAKKGLRPVGHRSVEVGFGLCFQQKWYPRVGVGAQCAPIAGIARHHRHRA